MVDHRPNEGPHRTRVKLGLGTAQLGMPYGIANHTGQPSIEEAGLILQEAKQGGIKVLDTAAGYGTSEKVIGDALRKSGLHFDIVSKVIAPKEGISIEREIAQSLERLGVDSLYGFLFHRAEDLLERSERAKKLWDSALSAKASGKVRKIGISLYHPEQIDEVFERYSIDLVQLPVSILDQRLVQNGYLKKIKDRGIEIHTRSAFLQGLLFMNPDHLPPALQGAATPLRRAQDLAEKSQRSLGEIALSFLYSVDEIDTFIVGVENHLQLRELVTFANFSRSFPKDFQREVSDLAISDPMILDPSRWSRK